MSSVSTYLCGSLDSRKILLLHDVESFVFAITEIAGRSVSDVRTVVHGERVQ